jgi:hypothetical protein
LPVVMTPILGLRPPVVIVLLSLLTWMNASIASRLWSWSRASWPKMVSCRRMLSPPAGIAKSAGPGMTMLSRFRLPSTTAVDSTVSCMHFSPTQVPVKRDIARP